MVQEENKAVPQDLLSMAEHPDLEGLIDSVFDQRFKIREFIRAEPHYCLFSVALVALLEAKDGLIYDNILQARVYDFNDVSPKTKRYRSRTLKRLTPHIMHTEDWYGRVVVIFNCGSAEASPVNTSAKRRITAPEEGSQTPSSTKAMTPGASKPKSSYKRESDRLRQRDRRAAKRRHQHELARDLGTPSDVVSQNKYLKKADLDKKTKSVLFLIHMAFNPRQHLVNFLTPGLRYAVKQFLQARGSKLDFGNDYEKAEYVEMKEKELVEIQRLDSKVVSLMRECHEDLGRLLRHQGSFLKGTEEWHRLQDNGIEQQKYWFRELRTAQDRLPVLSQENKVQISTLKKELRESSQAREDKKRENYQKWIHHVIPGTQTYAWLHSRL
ncbi:hypothetical protein F5Y16DRAFT_229779 [Xylariaceae sp. FL0255]|nr:hypothetical protein F5Y16DRAFT_229779 [Xylariaceae sp. FL0255]